MLQCVSVIDELSFKEKKARSGKEIKKRSINEYHITIFRYQESCHMSCFYSFFCGFYHIPGQKSSAQSFATEAVFDSTSESEQSASLASLVSLKQITSAIMSMASAFKAAQDASAVAADHPQAQDDVIMLSEDPILIVDSQGQETFKFSSPQDRGGNGKPHGQRSLSRGFSSPQRADSLAHDSSIILICCQYSFRQHQDHRWSSSTASGSSRSTSGDQHE